MHRERGGEGVPVGWPGIAGASSGNPYRPVCSLGTENHQKRQHEAVKTDQGQANSKMCLASN